MKEKVLNSRKNGMGMMLLLILLHLLAVAGLAVGIVYESIALMVLCILILSFGWILFCFCGWIPAILNIIFSMLGIGMKKREGGAPTPPEQPAEA